MLQVAEVEPVFLFFRRLIGLVKVFRQFGQAVHDGKRLTNTVKPPLCRNSEISALQLTYRCLDAVTSLFAFFPKFFYVRSQIPQRFYTSKVQI